MAGYELRLPQEGRRLLCSLLTMLHAGGVVYRSRAALAPHIQSVVAVVTTRVSQRLNVDVLTGTKPSRIPAPSPDRSKGRSVETTMTTTMATTTTAGLRTR